MGGSCVVVSTNYPIPSSSSCIIKNVKWQKKTHIDILHLGSSFSSSSSSSPSSASACISISNRRRFPWLSLRHGGSSVLAHLPSSSPNTSSTKLYVSGLSFRTTEESLRNAFQNFGQLVEVNLVMDKIANRPRGFAFIHYATEEESQKAIEGMHGKFLDGRVIFVEVAKSRSELRQSLKQNGRQF